MMEEEHESHPLTNQEQQLQQQEEAQKPSRSSKVSFSRIRILVGSLLGAGIIAAALFVFFRSSNSSAKLGAFDPSSSGTRDRTGFHFQPPRNWMNDPNGPVFYRGYYHLFYQFNPLGAIWDEKVSWGHAASTDLIHWTHLPLALEPSEWYDSRGCWSGSVTLLESNKPVIVYTGISKSGVQTQNAAVPEDPADPLLRNWRKLSENPLIPEPPEGIGRTSFRDPSTAWKDSLESPWRMVIGGKNGSSGVGFLYESADFISWRRTDWPIFSLEGTGMWECPDFFPVSGSRHVFKVSLGDPEVIGGVEESFDTYAIGTYFPANATFGVLEKLGSNSSNAAVVGLGRRLDHGNRFYASKTFEDPRKKRRVIWGWLSEADLREDDVSKGWASIQSVPRSIWLESDHNGEEHLMQLPVDEMKALRIQPGIEKLNTSVSPGSVVHLLHGSQLDVEIIFRLPDMTMQMGMENFDVDSGASAGDLCRVKGASVNGILGPFGLLVLATIDMQEQTAIFFHPGRSTRGLVALVCADHTRSSSGLNSKKKDPSMLYGAYVHLTDLSTVSGGVAGEHELSLRVLVDQSVVETFAQGGKVCITSRVYPRLAKGEAAHLFLFNNGSSNVEVKMVKAWNMKTVQLSGVH